MIPLSLLSDAELAHYAAVEADPIVTSSLERELTARLDRLLDEREEDKPLLDAVSEAGLDAEDLKAIIEVLAEFDADDPEVLREMLERAKAFAEIAGEAGDVVERLAKLIEGAA